MHGQNELRVGLVGAGMVSAHHLAAWSEIPSARVAAIADPELERAERRAAAFGIGSVYASAEHMLGEEQLHAIDIAAPVRYHGDLCRLACDHGVAILCQKPLAPTYREACQIVEDVSGRVRLMVHENWRFRASYRQIKTWLDADQIGVTQSVRFSVTSSGLIRDSNGEYPALVRQPFLSDLPRMLVFEVLIHHIDVLRWLFGELTVECAQLSRRSAAIRGEDTASVDFVTASGVRIGLDSSYAEPGAPRHVCDKLEILGEAGSIRLDDCRIVLDGRQPATRVWTFDELYRSAFEGGIRHFVERLADGGEFESSAASNIETLRLVEEIYAIAGGVISD